MWDSVCNYASTYPQLMEPCEIMGRAMPVVEKLMSD